MWYKSVLKGTCEFCSYFGLCTTNHTPGDVPPEGFVVGEIHPELDMEEIDEA